MKRIVFMPLPPCQCTAANVWAHLERVKTPWLRGAQNKTGPEHTCNKSSMATVTSPNKGYAVYSFVLDLQLKSTKQVRTFLPFSCHSVSSQMWPARHSGIGVKGLKDLCMLFLLLVYWYTRKERVPQGMGNCSILKVPVKWTWGAHLFWKPIRRTQGQVTNIICRKYVDCSGVRVVHSSFILFEISAM